MIFFILFYDIIFSFNSLTDILRILVIMSLKFLVIKIQLLFFLYLFSFFSSHHILYEFLSLVSPPSRIHPKLGFTSIISLNNIEFDLIRFKYNTKFCGFNLLL